MAKKITKNKDEKDTKKGKPEETEEEAPKDGGALSDGVLDAFEEAVPAVDPLLEDDEAIIPEEEEEDDIDSGDFKIPNDW